MLLSFSERGSERRHDEPETFDGEPGGLIDLRARSSASTVCLASSKSEQLAGDASWNSICAVRFG
jgi:hypothetical protein